MAVSTEVRQLCDEIRRFIRAEVDPRSREIEESDEVPEDLLQKAREIGLFGLTIPEEYGGIGLDLAGKCAVEEEMGKTNYGFATVIGNHTGISSTGIVTLGNAHQKRKYLPVMAITDASKGIKGISAFIVERDFPGFSIGRNELKMGMHGCTTAPLAFSDCEVPAENLLGAEGMGYIQAMKTLTAGGGTGGARGCGMMGK